MDQKKELLGKALRICSNLIQVTIIDKKSAILFLKKLEAQKKQELFTEWESRDILQDCIRNNEQQENFDMNLLGNLKAELVQKEIFLQNKVIEHQNILVMLRKNETSLEQTKLEELLFQTSQDILSGNTFDISCKISIGKQQTICTNMQKLYEKAVINLSKNNQTLEKLIII